MSDDDQTKKVHPGEERAKGLQQSDDHDKADRPGGPGQTGMNGVEPGEETPATDPDQD